MKVNVFIEKTGKQEIVEASNIEDVLKKLSINPETVLVCRGNKLITNKVKLNDNDTLKILSVVSGG